MKDEIKEILDKLKYTAKKHTIQILENGGKIEHCPQEIETELRLNTYSANILLDYITNLQEDYDRAMKLVDKGVENSYIKIKKQQKEIQRYKKFVDDILNFYKHNRYEEELTEDNMFKLVLNQNEMIMTIEEFKGDANVH